MLKNCRKQDGKIIINLFNYALLSVALILAGCTGQSPPSSPSAARSHIEDTRVSDTGKTKAMEITEAVLADMHFTIDKFDPNSGVIITRPLPGAQFFELWRSENIGAKNWINSNLHSIRRTVEVGWSEDSTHPTVCVVKVQRLSMPARQVTSSARAYEMFSRSNPTLQRLQLNPEQESRMAWIDMGTDTELEREILKRIKNKCETRNPKYENEDKL